MTKNIIIASLGILFIILVVIANIKANEAQEQFHSLRQQLEQCKGS